MRQIARLRALWVALGITALAIVLLVTLAPARDITHTALGWLRLETLEIEDLRSANGRVSARGAGRTDSNLGRGGRGC